jgi:hypothetical protein
MLSIPIRGLEGEGPMTARRRLLASVLTLGLLGGLLVLTTAPAQAATITYVATLSGAAESPPNASAGIGNAIVDIDTSAHTMRVRVTFSGLTGTTTASHIHAATAVPGVGTAGVATTTPTFTGFPGGVTAGTYDNTFDLTLASSWNPAFVTAHGGTPATAETFFAASLAAGTAYLNIHSTFAAGGEIRGFLQLDVTPTITCPANITVSNAPNQAGAVVTYPAPTTSGGNPPVTVIASQASGSFFLLGVTPVTATATDADGDAVSCTFTIRVNDTQPPTITCPANITVDATSPSGAVVTFSVTASDNAPGVTVVANPASGSTFPVGTTTVTATATDTSGNIATCSFTVTVRPLPGPPGAPTLQVLRVGTGSGTVTSSPPGINCPPDCSEQGASPRIHPTASGDVYVLTAHPAAGSVFTRWSGACSGNSPTCTVVLTSDTIVSAWFDLASSPPPSPSPSPSPTPPPAPVTFDLHASKVGKGRIVSDPAGITCGAGCTATFDEGATIILTATPHNGWMLKRWRHGGCSGTELTCTLAMSSNRHAEAVFIKVPIVCCVLPPASFRRAP